MPRTHKGNMPGKCHLCERRRYLYCPRYKCLVFQAIDPCKDRGARKAVL